METTWWPMLRVSWNTGHSLVACRWEVRNPSTLTRRWSVALIAEGNKICAVHPCESDALVSAGIASLLEPQRGHRTRLQSGQPERPADGQLIRPGRQQKTMLTNISGSGNLRPQLWTAFCRTTSLSSSGKASLPLKLLRKRPSASLSNRCEHSNGGHDAQQRCWRSLPARFRLI